MSSYLMVLSLCTLAVNGLLLVQVVVTLAITWDHRDDIFRVTSGGVDVFLSNGTRFVYTGSKWTTVSVSNWQVGDLTGDGKDDIFYAHVGGVNVFQSDGTKFIAKGIWSSEVAGINGWRVGDFTGDGKADLLRQVY